MEVNYTVHSCTEDAVVVKALVAGREVEATIMGLVVELNSEDGTMSHVLRLTPEDMAEAKAMFAVGNKVTSTFTLTETD